MKKRLVSLLLVLALAFTLVPSAFADKTDCGISACTCTGPCTYGTTNYRAENEKRHTYSVYCTVCGIGGGIVIPEAHTFSGNTCTKCGYTKSSGGGGWEEPDYCYHDRTRTTWDGCYWYEYCRDCGELVDSGVSHGATRYEDWEYYSRTQHRRYAYCADCGEGEYEYGRHSTREQYEQYTSSQHRVVDYCSTCDSSVGSATYESHSFSYGSWQNYNGTQHRRTKTCRDCGYSAYDYANHSYSYGSWQSTGDSQHRRTKTCSCGYSSYETENHDISYGSWQNYSATQHRRTEKCSTCGYSAYDYASHSFSYGAWANYSDEQHRRTKSCPCGYSTYEYGDHADANGDGLCDSCSKELTVYVDVTLDACGGVLTDNEVTVIFGDTYGELPEPTRKGYEFDGWYTEKDGGELVEAGTEVSGKAAHTLYAHWTLVKVFSVTVPAGLPLAVTEDGVVTSSTDAAIANNSTCEVKVTGISLHTENGWTLVPFTYNMAAAKVDSKLIGFAIGGAQSMNGGESESLALTGDWSIDAGAVLPLDYDANVSATSVGIDEQVLTVVFVVEEA